MKNMRKSLIFATLFVLGTCLDIQAQGRQLPENQANTLIANPHIIARKQGVVKVQARIETESAGRSKFYRIKGSVKNLNGRAITNVVVWYAITEGYSYTQALDSGGFHIRRRGSYYELPRNSIMGFSFPVETNGHLKIEAVTWNYMDGTAGIFNDVRKLNEYL